MISSYHFSLIPATGLETWSRCDFHSEAEDKHPDVTTTVLRNEEEYFVLIDKALSIGATLPQTPSNLGVFHRCLLELIRKWDFWASSKKRIRDTLLTWYPYLSLHDLDQLFFKLVLKDKSITPPLYDIITVHLIFGGQCYNLKYFLPLFSKVHQYWAIITIRTKHISQIRPFTISQTQAFLLVFAILSQEISSSFFSSPLSYASSHLYQNPTTQGRLS